MRLNSPQMSKVKAIIVGIIILFVFSLMLSVYFLTESNRKKDIEIARMAFNNFQLMQDNQDQTVLYLKQKEVSGQLKAERDSIAEALKIKPKTIEKIVYRTITEKDTLVQNVFVDYRKTHWMIQDTGKCFVWQAMAFLSDTTLKVTRTEFTYQNKITETYYRKKPKKFLFIRYGKWENFVQITPECGQVTIKTFNFEK